MLQKNAELERGLNLSMSLTLTIVRTCYRCGREFSISKAEGRVCPPCRKPRQRTRDTGGNLSFRETQIAQLVCKAKRNKEIAADLHLTEGTVKEYLNCIFRKISVKNRTELAIWTIQNLQIDTEFEPRVRVPA